MHAGEVDRHPTPRTDRRRGLVLALQSAHPHDVPGRQHHELVVDRKAAAR